MTELLFDIDEIVLSLYEMPIHLERDLLALFDGQARIGTLEQQPNSYMPTELGPSVSFQQFRRWHRDWEATNRRRLGLISESLTSALGDEEQDELVALQQYADFYIDAYEQLPLEALEQLDLAALVEHDGGRVEG
jgi:hypothetical protein